MFNENKISKIGNTLGLNNENCEVFIKRQAKYLKVSYRGLLNSYQLILFDCLLKQEKQKTYITKNIKILKYAKTIEKLYCVNGFGYLKTSRALKLNHKVDISPSALRVFITKNKFTKGTGDE